jgi:drug/metabolite transporter (DMT)-like permease
MSADSNAFAAAAVTVRPRPGAPLAGVALGLAGVVAFSLSFPATKLAVESLDPWFIAFGRAAVASALAAVVLVAGRAPRPSAAQLRGLAVVAGGVIVGFPLLTWIALETVGSAHAAVVIAVLPAATAVAAVLRGGERPGPLFWAAAAAGSLLVAGYVLGRSGGGHGLVLADVWLLLGVVVCGLGYAEGGRLARDLGGARTICWALVLSAPLTLPVAVISGIGGGVADASATAWGGFAYVSIFSMFLGFFAWYAGLSRGGIARVGQVQLAQPLLTIGWSALLLGEAVDLGLLGVALAVLACVAVAQRARVGRSS